jgi:hypothetical protein
MNFQVLFQIFSIIVPEVIALWKKIHFSDPKYADYTDAMIFSDLINNSQALIDDINAWEASHPRV